MKQTRNFKQVQLIFYALFVGQVMVGAILWLQMKGRLVDGNGDTALFSILVPIIVVAGVVASFLLQRYSLRDVASIQGAEKKWEHYQKIWILRVVLQEGANMTAMVLALMTEKPKLILWFAIGVAAFILLRPSLFSFGNDYDVAESDLENIAS